MAPHNLGDFVDQYMIPEATEKTNKALKGMAEGFAVTDKKMDDIVDEFHKSMKLGLEGNKHGMPMIPSFVRGRPTGKEEGTYLALDLGGTNLRVCLITLNGDSTFSLTQQKFTIPEEAKERTLFDWIATCVSTFVEQRQLEPKNGKNYIPCGFTFSFPINQTGIAEGTLVMWNKGFSVPGCVGRDVVRLTQDAFLRQHVPVRVVAIVNDTVGCLMASSYAHPDTQMGIIFGTGTNACYWEKLENVPKWTEDKKGEMVINMEWGAFDNELHVLPYTMHDNKLNRKSTNHGLQVFEKMISGMFLGEVARNALLHFVDNRLLFGGRSSSIMNKSYSLDTAYISSIVADDSEDLTDVRDVFEKTMNIPDTTLLDRKIAQNICRMISVRAERLSAAAMAAVLLWRPENLTKSCTIGIDGSMYQFFPGFEEALYDNCRHNLGDDFVDNRLHLSLARDGSGVGAAIIAMSVDKGQ